MDSLQPTPTPAFTTSTDTSTDTSNITPQQEQNLLDMAQFLKDELSK